MGTAERYSSLPCLPL